MQSTIKKSLIAATIIFASTGNAENFTLSIDKYYSPYMGANWMIAGLRGYEALDDIIFSGTAGDYSPKATFIRTGKLALDYTVSSLATVIQHEVFGHGARAREANLNDIGYHIHLFSGTTTYSGQQFAQLDINRRAAIESGGVEATSILAQQMEQDFLVSNTIDHRDATMYLVNSLDQTVYALGTSSHWFHPDNDAQGYINQVNNFFGNNQALTSTNIRNAAIFDWLDPMLYLSAYSIFNYIWYGDPYINFTTWHIGDMRFMPTTRMLLAPYGPEIMLKINLFTPEERYIGVYLRTGKTEGLASYGIDLVVDPIGNIGKVSLSNTLSAWWQPHLLKDVSAQLSGRKYGFAEFIRASLQMNKYSAAFAEIGYKTSGYLQGTPLGSNVVWRFGATFSLDVNPKPLV